MKVLLLSPHKCLIDVFDKHGDQVIQTTDPIIYSMLEGIDWIVSYGYRYKINKWVIHKIKGNAINLHISYLPWGRGADPNLWSFLEDTPKGVTIHYINEGIDMGDIITRRLIGYDMETDTLNSTYKRLSETIEKLFSEYWCSIREKHIKSIPQSTYHRSIEKEKYRHLLTKGWDTPIKDIIEKGMIKCHK